MVAVGPFDNQRQAMEWISDLVAANPNEKTVIAVNETSPRNIRVYVSDFGEEPPPIDAFPEIHFLR